MAMTAREILVKARELIADPARWWPGQGFLRKAGQTCALFALDDASDSDAFLYAESHRFLSHAMKSSVIVFNDTHSHAEVLGAFDRAITRAAELEATP